MLCDAHVPGGGLLYQDHLLFDFHSFPLRIAEVADRPQEGVLRVGFMDSIYGRSRGGVTPSGWRCEHLPYLVELDNWGVSTRAGKPGVGGCWVWGYVGSKAMDVERHNHRQIEQLNQRGGRMLSIVDLIQAGTISVEMAAYAMRAMAEGASLLTAARPGGAGKTTLMAALVGLLPSDVPLVTVDKFSHHP